MVTYEPNGDDRVDLTIDPDIGLEPHDADAVAGLLRAVDIPAQVVQVNILGPSTTDRALLQQLLSNVKQQLDQWGKVGAFNILVPPPQ